MAVCSSAHGKLSFLLVVPTANPLQTRPVDPKRVTLIAQSLADGNTQSLAASASRGSGEGLASRNGLTVLGGGSTQLANGYTKFGSGIWDLGRGMVVESRWERICVAAAKDWWCSGLGDDLRASASFLVRTCLVERYLSSPEDEGMQC